MKNSHKNLQEQTALLNKLSLEIKRYNDTLAKVIDNGASLGDYRVFMLKTITTELVKSFDILFKEIRKTACHVRKFPLFSFMKTQGLKVYKSWTKEKMVTELFNQQVRIINGCA